MIRLSSGQTADTSYTPIPPDLDAPLGELTSCMRADTNFHNLANFYMGGFYVVCNTLYCAQVRCFYLFLVPSVQGLNEGLVYV